MGDMDSRTPPVVASEAQETLASDGDRTHDQEFIEFTGPMNSSKLLLYPLSYGRIFILASFMSTSN